MCRCHGADAALGEHREDRDGKRRALCRVGTGAELIEQDEGIAVCFVEEGNHIRHVGGEGTQRMLDALLITDIGVNLVENGKGGSVECRNVKSGLAHQC